MSSIIVEDRILARVARDAVGWDDAGIAAAERAETALDRAVLALRAMGIAPTREVTQAVRDDIALVLAEGAPKAPALLAA